MAHVSHQLPCNSEGVCMKCKQKPSEEETLLCKTCVTPWHATCLSPPPQTLGETVEWECPDCVPNLTTDFPTDLGFVGSSSSSQASELVAAIKVIEADQTLNEVQKAKKRQTLLSNGLGGSGNGEDDEDLAFRCSFCMQLPERPVTTPCGHNFCLKCFEKWIGQGKRTCAKCRASIPPKMASQPRINASLVEAIRHAKKSKTDSSVGSVKVSPYIHNQQRPDKAFTTKRAKKTGKANACSGKIFVTNPPDHFGPILAEHDPLRNTGVLVGESWEDRLDCRQWGAHLPHVAGIAGQSEYGAQSVALSGGYEDDEDHGEWFLYTGSGGRDLSGNKRTNKSQSFDQKFDKYNEALRVSCKKGYPVRVVRDCIRVRYYEVGKGDRVRFWEDTWIGERALCKDFRNFYAMSNKKNHPLKDFVVVQNDIASWDIDLRLRFNDWEIEALATLLARLGTPPVLNEQEDKLVLAQTWSHKEKRSAYAPENGVRYDGVYRIEKCWRKVGVQGYKVCRYLFVRCDNAPAPWTSDEHGDRPRLLPDIEELKEATDITERKAGPSWDFDEEDGFWKWKKAPPASQKIKSNDENKKTRKSRKGKDPKQQLKALGCLICKKVLNLPVTAPCGHNFCKSCIEATFAGTSHVRKRIEGGTRTLRTKKNVMKCPVCACDISDFLQNPQINREMMAVIEFLQQSAKENSNEKSVAVDEMEVEDAEANNSKRRRVEVGSEEVDAADASQCQDSPSSTLHINGVMDAENSSSVSLNEGNDSSLSSPNTQSGEDK